MLELEYLERRDCPATAVSLQGGILQVVGDGAENTVSVSQQGRKLNVDVVDKATFATSFEDLNGDGTDAVDFAIGDGGDNQALFSGGAAGTRQFPPGYNTGAFAFITVGQSQIDFTTPANNVKFFAKDVAELNPNVVGKITFVGLSGNRVDVDVPEAFASIDSADFIQEPVVQVIIDNGGTGVTNIDDFEFTTLNQQTFTFNTRAVQLVFATLGDGDDTFINNTRKVSVVDGGRGDDLLIGGRRTDVLLGGDGNDILVGGRGRDILIGGRGSDLIDADRRDLVFADPLDFLF